MSLSPRRYISCRPILLACSQSVVQRIAAPRSTQCAAPAAPAGSAISHSRRASPRRPSVYTGHENSAPLSSEGAIASAGGWASPPSSTPRSRSTGRGAWMTLDSGAAPPPLLLPLAIGSSVRPFARESHAAPAIDSSRRTLSSDCETRRACAGTYLLARARSSAPLRSCPRPPQPPSAWRGCCRSRWSPPPLPGPAASHAR